MEEADKDWMIRMVGGRVFLLVPDYRLTWVVPDKGP